MARQRRRKKHRGTQAGTVRAPTRGRAGSSRASPRPSLRRGERPPTWRTSFGRAAVSAAILLAVFVLVLDQDIGVALWFTLLALLFYTPLFHLSDTLIYRRRQRKRREAAG